MDFSIVLCTYNRSYDLEKVLKQLDEQLSRNSVNAEVLVVDNNSSDNTKELAKSFEKKNSNFRYIFEGQQGKPFALNEGIRQAKSEWLIFTDDDVVLSDEWCLSINEFVKKTQYKCFMGKVNALWRVDRPDWYSNSMFSVIVEVDQGDQIKHNIPYLVGCNMGIHRSVFEKYGMFDENIKRFEDSEISSRFSKEIDIVYIPNIIVDHPVEKERLTKKYFRKWYYEKGKFDTTVIDMNDKPILHVPRWVYRKLLEHSIGWLKSIEPSKRFIDETQIYKYLGLINMSWSKAKKTVRS